MVNEITALGAVLLLTTTSIILFLSYKFGSKKQVVKNNVVINTESKIDYSFKEPERFPGETRQHYLNRRMLWKSEYDIKQTKKEIEECVSKEKRDTLQLKLYALLDQREALLTK